METTNLKTKNEATHQTKLESLFKESMQLAGDADLNFKIKNTLMMLALEYIQSERIDGESLEIRRNFAFHLTILNDIMDNLSECKKLPPDEKLLHFKDRIDTGTEYASEIKETLNSLSLVYIRSELIEAPKKVRDIIAYHFYLLNCLIDDLIEYSQAVPLAERYH